MVATFYGILWQLSNNYHEKLDIESIKCRVGNRSIMESKLQKRLFNFKEAVVYLGQTVWAVRKMLWAGKMPYVRDGKRILLDIKDMDERIEKSKTATRIKFF